MASFVVGPWASLAATFNPDTSEVSYDPVEAAAAKVRCWTLHDRRAAWCAVRARDDLEIIVEGDGVGNWQSFGRRGEAIDLQKKCLVEKLPSNFRQQGTFSESRDWIRSARFSSRTLAQCRFKDWPH